MGGALYDPVEKAISLKEPLLPSTNDENKVASCSKMGATPFGVNLPADFSSQLLYISFLERYVRRRFGITHLAIFAPNSLPSLLFRQNRLLLGFQQWMDKFSTRNIY
jgi:hypothetical protein